MVYLVEAARKASEFARPWRDKRFAHADLARAVDPSPDSLRKATLPRVKAALDAVHAVLNAISERVLGESIQNDVVIRPRARAFMAYVRQLAGSVQYIDSIIDPSGETDFTDVAVARTFLRKLDSRPTSQEVREAIELREAARGFGRPDKTESRQ